MLQREYEDELSDGGLTLTNARLLAPHLTADDHALLLDSACHKTKREVEQVFGPRAARTAQ